MAGSKKQDLLRAAAALIHKQGFLATSVEQIVQEAGTQKALFYYYWKSKEEMGLDVLDWHTARIRESVLVQTSSEPLTDVQRIIDTLVAFRRQDFAGRGCPIGNLALEMSAASDAFRTRAARALTVVAEAFAQRFSELKRQGKLRPDVDPLGAGRFVVASLEGAIMWHKATRDAEMFADQMESLKEYIHGLLAH
jgi:TetR/AcrR family transcriptional repressor of nem operon